MVFQHFNLFPHLSVLEKHHLRVCRILKKMSKDEADKAKGTSDRRAEERRCLSHAWSYQKRVAIARRWAMNPDIMLLDELSCAWPRDGRYVEVETLTQEGMWPWSYITRWDLSKEAVTRVIFSGRWWLWKKGGTKVVFWQSGQNSIHIFWIKFWSSIAVWQSA